MACCCDRKKPESSRPYCGRHRIAGEFQWRRGWDWWCPGNPSCDKRRKPPACPDIFLRRDMPRSPAWHVTSEEDIRARRRSEEHTSELQSRGHLVCRLLLEKK